MSNSKNNRLMMKFAEQMEEKINQIRFLQAKIQGMTYEQIQTDPESMAVDKKIKGLLEEIYG
jgi:hypothetical protein